MKHALYALALIATSALAETPDEAEYHAILAKQEQGFRNREIAFQALNAADAAETCAFVSSGRGTEANPLFGSHPACGKVVAIKAGFGLLHYLIAKHLEPAAARKLQIVSLVIQGGVVAANLRLVF